MLVISDKRKLEIARVAYDVDGAYCRSIGEDSTRGWEEVSAEIKESLLAGVNRHLENPEITPEAMHQSWLDQKEADGWIYGEDVDHDLKVHPLMVPYAEVPEEQRVKDHLFKAVVGALAAMPEVELGDKVVTKEITRKPVKYIGKREEYTDGLYKTGLTWKKGQIHMVPNSQAVQLLNHKDQYELGEISDVVMEEAPAAAVNDSPLSEDDDQKTEEAEESKIQDAKDMIMALKDPKLVKEYVATNFAGQKLHHALGLEKSQQAAIQLIDQFGLE